MIVVIKYEETDLGSRRKVQATTNPMGCARIPKMLTSGCQESRNTISDSKGLIEARFNGADGMMKSRITDDFGTCPIPSGEVSGERYGNWCRVLEWRRGCAGVYGEEGIRVPVTGLVVNSYWGIAEREGKGMRTSS
jgi:hypothetical protein